MIRDELFEGGSKAMRTMSRREVLSAVFQDTQEFYTSSPELQAAIKATMSCTVVYEENDYPPLPEKRLNSCEITVTKNKSFEAAMLHRKAYPNAHITVLNFASAVNPGGGVKNGSSAQEESLCRCSTLYPALDRRSLWDRYYSVNRQLNTPLHSDACIWTPGIVICKTDTYIPDRIEPKDWVVVDIISCAAPNLRTVTGNMYNPERSKSIHLPADEQYNLHLKRAKHILHVAAAHMTDKLILGAFGCGAFENDPAAVARAYHDVLPDYVQYFSSVEFAVYCREHETENYDAFRKIIGEQKV